MGAKLTSGPTSGVLNGHRLLCGWQTARMRRSDHTERHLMLSRVGETLAENAGVCRQRRNRSSTQGKTAAVPQFIFHWQLPTTSRQTHKLGALINKINYRCGGDWPNVRCTYRAGSSSEHLRAELWARTLCSSDRVAQLDMHWHLVRPGVRK